MEQFGTFAPTIEVFRSRGEVESELREQLGITNIEWETKWRKPRRLLKVAVKRPVPDEIVEGRTVGGEVVRNDEMRSREIHRLFIRSTFEKRLYDLVVVANLARIGSLQLSSGVIVQYGEEKSRTDTMGNGMLFHDSLDLALSIEWPTLHTLAIADVWNWAIKQDGFLRGFGGFYRQSTQRFYSSI